MKCVCVCVCLENWARRKTKYEVQRTANVVWDGGNGSMTTVKNMAMAQSILYQVFILIRFMSLRIFQCTYVLLRTVWVRFPIFAITAVSRSGWVWGYVREIEFSNYVFLSVLFSSHSHSLGFVPPLRFLTLTLHSASHIVKLFHCFVVCLQHCKNEKKRPLLHVAINNNTTNEERMSK